MNYEHFNDALEAYVKARIAQDRWDAIAPAGLSTSQQKKEQDFAKKVEVSLAALIATTV